MKKQRCMKMKEEKEKDLEARPSTHRARKGSVVPILTDNRSGYLYPYDIALLRVWEEILVRVFIPWHDRKFAGT